jgi:tartrate dehydrogenase/decarboxylase/D-malate dehydrogenase
MRTYKIALIPGDGIGVDVINAGWRVLRKAARRFGFRLQGKAFPWSCNYYLETGEMMPKEGIELLRGFDAIYLGAVGWPDRVSDAISLHDLLLTIRKYFDLYVNVRPHRLLSGVEGPLKSRNFDILCVRENTEGECSGAGGRVHIGTPHEVVVQTSIFTRRAVERVLRYAFEQARQRRKRLASVTKSNAQQHTMVFWDEITDRLAREYPDVKVTRYYIDAIAARFVSHPQTLDVVVASNLFGDILTNIGAAIQGGLGFAASANINPQGGVPSMFEPVHGSAPDITDTGAANPIATIWAGALMLGYLNEVEAARAVMVAVEAVTSAGTVGTPDMGGVATTEQLTDVVCEVLAR